MSCIEPSMNIYVLVYTHGPLDVLARSADNLRLAELHFLSGSFSAQHESNLSDAVMTGERRPRSGVQFSFE